MFLNGGSQTVVMRATDSIGFDATETHLESLVQQRLGSRVRGLRVTVCGDGVILKGLATTYHAKQLAQHAAMELGNLPILANDIEVQRRPLGVA